HTRFSRDWSSDVCSSDLQINDQMKEPMFFGNPVNVSRYDQQKYGIFEKLIEKQLSFFWRPEEVDVSKDRIDYQNLPEHEKHIFKIGRASCRERVEYLEVD